MRKSIVFIIVLLAAMFCITACKSDSGATDTPAETPIEQPSDTPTDEPDDEPDEPAIEYVTVTFDSNGGTAVAPVKVKKGETVACPEVFYSGSTLENPLVFDGWFLGDDKWQFENGVEQDITLVAHWKSDGRYTEPIIPD